MRFVISKKNVREELPADADDALTVHDENFTDVEAHGEKIRPTSLRELNHIFQVLEENRDIAKVDSSPQGDRLVIQGNGNDNSQDIRNLLDAHAVVGWNVTAQHKQKNSAEVEPAQRPRF